MSTSNYKKENKNTKALFSVICLCIIALGLIVYFSANTNVKNNAVNQATTIKESTTEVQRAVTIKETTTKITTTAYTKKATTSKTTTKPVTMEMKKSNTPYKSYYKYPLSEVVIKGYSEELSYDETMGDYRSHPAIDFAGKAGEKVVAINDGIVTKVFKSTMYGTCVEIDHGGNLVAYYYGLESANVKKGQMLDIGNQIGVLGNVPCEISQKPHLHFETKIKEKFVNPLDVMCKTE